MEGWQQPVINVICMYNSIIGIGSTEQCNEAFHTTVCSQMSESWLQIPLLFFLLFFPFSSPLLSGRTECSILGHTIFRGYLPANSSPPGRVDDKGHQQTGDQTCARKGNNPASVDPKDHAPVDGAPITRAQANTDGSTRNALRSRHGKFCKC